MANHFEELHLAIANDNVALLKKLLTPKNVNFVDIGRRMTLLMWSVSLCKHKSAELLISYGASLHPRDLFHFNVIHHAVWRADVKMMKILLCSSPEKNILCKDTGVSERREKGFCFRRGAKSLVDLPHPLTNRTPLMLAAIRGDVNMVDFLLSRAGSDIHLKDSFGHTAMDLAAQFGHKAVVTFLLSKGDESADLAFDNARRQAEENCENAATVPQLKVLTELNVLLCQDWFPQSLVGFS